MIIIRKKASFNMQDFMKEIDEDQKNPVKPVIPQVPPKPEPVAPIPAKVQPEPQVQAPIPQIPETPSVAPQQKQIPSPSGSTINSLFDQAAKAMGLEEGKKYTEIPKVPDYYLEQMLESNLSMAKLKGEKLGDFLSSKMTEEEVGGKGDEKKYILPSREKMKEYIEARIHYLFTRQKIKGWDLEKDIVNSFLYNVPTTENRHVSAIQSIISNLETEGIPIHIQEMFPGPEQGSWQVLKNKNKMDMRIKAERLTEMYREKNWEYGKPPVNEQGQPIRAGEEGSRTHAATEELNRTYDILSKIKTPDWQAPANLASLKTTPVKPFQGTVGYKSFLNMVKLLKYAIKKNKETGGQIERSINATLSPANSITLDPMQWAKGGQNYVDAEMIDPIQPHRDTMDFYNALMSAKQGISYDVRGEEGQLIREYSTKSKALEESEEEASEKKDIIKKAYDPLELVIKPLVSTYEHADLPMKRKFTVPNVTNKVFDHIFPSPAPKTKADVQRRLQEIDAEADKIMDMEPSEEVSRKLASLEEEEKILKKALEVPDESKTKEAYDFYLGQQTGIKKHEIQQILKRMYHREQGAPKPMLPLSATPEQIQNFIRSQRFMEGATDDAVKMVADNISKVVSNYAKINSMTRNRKGAKELIEPKIKELTKKYQTEVQKPVIYDDIIGRSERMEADVKLAILKFMQDQIDGAAKGVNVEQYILEELGKRKELLGNYTQEELESGSVFLSHQNNLATQRLLHLIVSVSREILQNVYNEGKEKGTLTAKVLQNIKVALFMAKNCIVKMG